MKNSKIKKPPKMEVFYFTSSSEILFGILIAEPLDCW